MKTTWSVAPSNVELSVEARCLLVRGFDMHNLNDVRFDADSIYALRVIRRFSNETGAQQEIDDIIDAIQIHGAVTLKASK